MEHPLNDISAAELKERITTDKLQILDVREQLEYFTYNIGGQNLPLGDLPERIKSFGYNKDEEIVVICQRGIRSETARRILAASGFTNVRNLTGGLLAYRKITEQKEY